MIRRAKTGSIVFHKDSDGTTTRLIVEQQYYSSAPPSAKGSRIRARDENGDLWDTFARTCFRHGKPDKE